MQKIPPPPGITASVKKLGFADLHVISVGWGKHISEDNAREYSKHLEGSGRYDLVIEATPLGLLKEIMEDEDITVTPALEDYVYKCVVKEYSGVCSQWHGVILPFLDAALAYVLENKLSAHSAAAKVMGTGVAIVSMNPYVPACLHSIHSKDNLLSVIEECSAYARANLPTRGNNCGRWGTRLVPEGFTHVLATILGPGWRACELPGRGKRCVMVMMPDISLVQFFKIGDGVNVGGRVNLFTNIPCQPKDRGVSVFECIFDELTNRTTVYDCATANGVDVRQQCLSLRVKAAVDVLGGKYLESQYEEEDDNISVAKYTPPITVVDKNLAERVLFVRDAAPLGQFPGGDAYAWKAPTLHPGMYVLTCRCGECMAVAEHGNCLLRKVGDLINPQGTKHMGTYVCEPVPAGPDSRSPTAHQMWRSLRPARNSERLFTAEECAMDRYPNTQITRGGMIKLLGQISPGGAEGSRLPVYAAKHPPPPKPASKPKPKPVADEDGWMNVPVSSSLYTTAQKPKKKTFSPKKAAPGEKRISAFSALRDDEGGDAWATVSKKK
jgi:hypothetical protein